jgi:hypothetical protein
MIGASSMLAYEVLAYGIRSRGIDTVLGLMSNHTALFVTTLGKRCCAARHEVIAVLRTESSHHECRKA